MSELKVGPKINKSPAPPAGGDVGSAGATEQVSKVGAVTTTPAPSVDKQQPTQGPVAALFQDTKKEATTKKPGTLKPHEALMTSVNKPKHSSFAAAFSSVLGKGALDELKAVIGNKPIVLIAGDQCTGKGTAAEGLVNELGGENSGTGTVLRGLAKENGLSIEQMSAMLSGKSVTQDDGTKVSLSDFPHLGDASDVDVKLDFRAAKAIASSSLQKADGKNIDISVFESRLAGHLGQFLEGLGRENVVSVYLYASPKVQAERYLEREVFAPATKAAETKTQQGTVAEARARAAIVIAGLDEKAPLGTCLQKLAEALHDSGVAGLDTLAAKVSGIAGRDDNDKTRLLSLYGVNYQDRSAFDVVVDTNGKSPDQVKQAILEAVALKTKQSSSSSSSA